MQKIYGRRKKSEKKGNKNKGWWRDSLEEGKD